MPVQSANELAQLINTLAGQFNDHNSNTGTLCTQAQTHIQHVQDEGGNWITHEIQNILSEWQAHYQALKNLESWFAAHATKLPNLVQEVEKLSTEVL